jgi:spore maturation protein CgeB
MSHDTESIVTPGCAATSVPRQESSYARHRVLVIGSYAPPDSMESHVTAALEQMGMEVEFFPAVLPFAGIGNVIQKSVSKLIHLSVREPERILERRLLRVVERFAPSLILVIMGNQVSPKTIAKVRARTQAPIVCWCQDQMTTLGRQYLLGSHYDMVFLKDRYLQDIFSRMVRSTTFRYLPEACNPLVHRTITLSAADRAMYGCDVMVAGSLYYYRQEILQALGELDVKVWGYSPGWIVYRLGQRHTGREVYCDDKVRAATAARIALNPMHFAEIDGLNCRAFELAGCGAFQICSFKPVLQLHFDPGSEIETFSTAEDLVEKVHHYLRHPD